MNINIRKTVLILFNTRMQTSVFNYSFYGLELKRVSEYKYVGVTFTTTLACAKPINLVCTKSVNELGYLRHTLRTAPQETKLLIRPVLEYASIVWYPYKKGEIKEIESVQNKAIRFICHRYDRDFSPTSALSSQT